MFQFCYHQKFSFLFLGTFVKISLTVFMLRWGKYFLVFWPFCSSSYAFTHLSGELGTFFASVYRRSFLAMVVLRNTIQILFSLINHLLKTWRNWFQTRPVTHETFLININQAFVEIDRLTVKWSSIKSAVSSTFFSRGSQVSELLASHSGPGSATIHPRKGQNQQQILKLEFSLIEKLAKNVGQLVVLHKHPSKMGAKISVNHNETVC